MKNVNALDNVSIVLVDTKTPANIGAVARCMMNMGLSCLALVNPRKDPNGEAVRLAAGAETILDNAAIFSSLADAVAGHGLVIGTSRHPGRLRKHVRSPREMAADAAPLLAKNRVALVFGNEVNGLAIADLSLCQALVSIPSSPKFPSLNLSHAVMVMAYELFIASAERMPAAEVELAPAQDQEAFFRHLQQTLQQIGFLDAGHPERMMVSLRRIFGKARLDPRETAILRGILSECDRTLRNRRTT